MVIPVITAIIFWMSYVLPVLYMILKHAELNNLEFVKRRKTHVFVAGETMYVVESYTLSSNSALDEVELPQRRGRARSVVRLDRLWRE